MTAGERSSECPANRPAGAHASLAELAKAQHGVVSIRQLLGSLGYSQSAVARRVASGHLHRLYQGVYAVGHTSLSLRGQCLAAVLACGPGALLSHGSAAWLWEISARGPAPFHVTGPIRRRPKTPLRVHHSEILVAADRALVDNIPVTALPRTLLDIAAGPQRSFERALERSEQQEIFDLGATEELLSRAGGHPGVRRLRRGIDIFRPRGAVFRSKLERRFLEAVEAAGLPRPSVNVFVAGYELDMYWEEERLAVELDVFETHGTRSSFESDRLRDEELKLSGLETIRVTGPRFDREPEQVLASVSRLLERRRRALPSQPL